ncbi:hypothetical protein ACFLZY_00710 [Patescibacteria group bacterium]
MRFIIAEGPGLSKITQVDTLPILEMVLKVFRPSHLTDETWNDFYPGFTHGEKFKVYIFITRMEMCVPGSRFELWGYVSTDRNFLQKTAYDRYGLVAPETGTTTPRFHAFYDVRGKTGLRGWMENERWYISDTPTLAVPDVDKLVCKQQICEQDDQLPPHLDPIDCSDHESYGFIGWAKRLKNDPSCSMGGGRIVQYFLVFSNRGGQPGERLGAVFHHKEYIGASGKPYTSEWHVHPYSHDNQLTEE